jgi:hypothetical protein
MVLYLVKDESFLDEDVPEQFPDSTIIIEGEDGEDDLVVQRKWRDYAPFYKVKDGKAYIRCVHVLPGATTANGLPHEELLIWWEAYNPDMIDMATYNALLN